MADGGARVSGSHEVNHGKANLIGHLKVTLDRSKYPLVNIQKAIENGLVEIVSFPIKNGGSFHSYICKRLPEGNPNRGIPQQYAST